MSFDLRPPYRRPADDRLAMADAALTKVEEFIAPGSSVLTSLLVRALLALQCTTAEGLWAIYDRIAAGKYLARMLKDLPGDVRYLVTEHNPPAGLSTMDGVLHIDSESSVWGDVVITLPIEDHSALPLTLLERFPVTAAGHMAFLEFVRDEIRNAAEAKRRQLEREYSNATIESMVRGIKWAEARARFAALLDLPDGERAAIDGILRRELTVGAVEQIDVLLGPAVSDLRDTFERIRWERTSVGLPADANCVVDLPADWDGTLDALPAAKLYGYKVDNIVLGPTYFHGNKFPIHNYDCLAVPGNKPSICPSADRKPQTEWLPSIERRFRELRLVGDGQTIHWVGSQSKAGSVCGCFSTEKNANAGSSGPGETVYSRPSGFMGGAALADALGVHLTQRGAFSKQLERERQKLADGCWIEAANRRPNAPHYLYLASDPAIQAIAAAYQQPKLA